MTSSILGLQDIQARAVLCPLSGKGEAVPMPYRTLSIGTGGSVMNQVFLFIKAWESK